MLRLVSIICAHKKIMGILHTKDISHAKNSQLVVWCSKAARTIKEVLDKIVKGVFSKITIKKFINTNY